MKNNITYRHCSKPWKWVMRWLVVIALCAVATVVFAACTEEASLTPPPATIIRASGDGATPAAPAVGKPSQPQQPAMVQPTGSYPRPTQPPMPTVSYPADKYPKK